MRQKVLSYNNSDFQKSKKLPPILNNSDKKEIYKNNYLNKKQTP